MVAIAFAAIGAGAIALIAGLKGASIKSVVEGKPDTANVHEVDTGGTLAPVGSSASSPAGAGSWKAELQAIAKGRKWSAGAWEQVVQKESGGNVHAVNPTSGAKGLGQFLGATLERYAPQGAGSGNPIREIRAMGAYIADRYGNPTAALAHEEAFHWY